MLKTMCVAVLVMLAGCGPTVRYTPIMNTITQYNAVVNQVQLGDTKEKVLSILEPTQEGLPMTAKKPMESYTRDGKVVQIYYFRSTQFGDNRTTDDEFTPFVFTDGVLTSIGWETLGGPKSHNQSAPFEF
jgi:hypothetical protein